LIAVDPDVPRQLWRCFADDRDARVPGLHALAMIVLEDFVTRHHLRSGDV
jgi:hypothetical protein